MKLKKMMALALASTALIAAAGCGGNSEPAKSGAASGAKVTGQVTSSGSSALLPLVKDAAAKFKSKNPEVSLTLNAGGSGTGLKQVAEGSVNIGNSDVPAEKKLPAEKAKGLVDHKVCTMTVATIINKDIADKVKSLTSQQLQDVFTAKVTNWKDVGGNDAPIVVVGREAGSGTRGAFEELLKLEDACKYSNELDSTGAVMAKVASTPGSIGYVSLDVLDDTVKALKLDGAEPTEENIKAGKYFLSRPFVMATKGEISEQSDLVKALFDFIYSDEGSELVKSVGLITADK